MREIKFREKTENGFHYWGFINGEFIGPASPENHSDEFTGLRDKNGREIYQGDVVLHQFNKDCPVRKAEVVFIPGCFELDYEDQGCANMAMRTEDNEDVYEVIGNIHANPELLK